MPRGQPFRLPPLNGLRVFWAVMRVGSFRAAADELSVTPQAVSQQIKQLEDILGVPLFLRKGRVVEPTEPAIVLSHFVEAGFSELSEGVRRVILAGQRRRININVSPYFATRYLMERLDSFRRRLPDLDLRLTTRVETPDFAADEVDASIQWGFGSWGDLDAQLLVRDHKILCCAAALAKTIAKPQDLTAHSLLHPLMSRQHWAQVLAFLDVDGPQDASVLEVHDAATMRRATLSGLGVGLISRIDALQDIEAGRLVAPLGLDALAGMPESQVPGFYLVLPRAHKRLKTVAAFCEWITAEDWQGLDPQMKGE